MSRYKNLSDDEKKLYKRAYALGLTEWHWTAAHILYAVHGIENALKFIEDCGGGKEDAQITKDVSVVVEGENHREGQRCATARGRVTSERWERGIA